MGSKGPNSISLVLKVKYHLLILCAIIQNRLELIALLDWFVIKHR